MKALVRGLCIVTSQDLEQYPEAQNPVIEKNGCHSDSCYFFFIVPFVSIKNVSVITSTNCFRAFKFGKEPMMLIAINRSGLGGSYRRSEGCLFVVRWLLEHDWQSRTVVFKLFAMSGK